MSLSDEDKKLIGGSDIGAILGVSRFKRPIDVWRRIVEGREVAQTKAMRRGVLMEPVIREMYREETGAELLGPKSLRHPRLSFARASLDDVARVNGELRVAEFKSSSVHMLADYAACEDGVPPEYATQVHWYMGTVEMPKADIAVYFGGDEFQIHPFTFDADLYEGLCEIATKFWKDHVLTGTPPPIDGSDSYGEWIRQRFPVEVRTPLKRADPEAEQWATEYRAICRQLEELETAKKLLKQHLELAIGDAEGIEGGFGRLRRITSKTVAWKQVAESLGANDPIIKAHTSTYAKLQPFWKAAK